MGKGLAEISIHALLAESDLKRLRWLIDFIIFLSTLSLRRATSANPFPITSPTTFLSTLSLRRATVGAPEGADPWYISIHALLAESDCGHVTGVSTHCNFYPRSPCGERHYQDKFSIPSDDISIHALLAESDKELINKSSKLSRFLSTLSLRRATTLPGLLIGCINNFYPRSPCGERPPRGGSCYLDNIISIHALLAESDSFFGSDYYKTRISIHALLAESDL